MRPTLKIAALAVAIFAVPAFAKGGHTHQCTKDGSVIEKKKKECAAEGGKWEPIPVKAGTAKPAGK